MLFLEVSSKNGRNVEQTFLDLTREIKNNRAANPSEDDHINLQAKKSQADKKAGCAC
jgi:hypothetical protein